jgi:hypothetical protein
VKLIVKQPTGEQITVDFLNSSPSVENPNRPALASFRAVPQAERHAFEPDVLIAVVKVVGQVGTSFVATWIYDHLKERFSRRVPRGVMLGSDHLDFSDARRSETQEVIAKHVESNREEA